MMLTFPQFHINTIAPLDSLPHQRRLSIYRHFGMGIGREAYLSSRCYIAHPSQLDCIQLGDRTFLNHFCFLENGAAITIGDDTCLGPGVRLLTTTHQIGASDRRVGHGCIRKPVTIGKGCWLGAGVTVLPGVTIGDGCVIGAGAIVTRDCAADGLYLGVPAQQVRQLEDVHSRRLHARAR